jgi:UDP-2,3-diacylglucosamine pyrophosphatase LpxH
MKNKVVVLSDIHLSDNSPTSWYQKVIHQEYLLAIFEWVVSHSDEVSELVLLGDIVDFWTSPFDVVPPTFRHIVEQNELVLGPDGGLARVLDALDGAVTYVRGNHDMMVTESDVTSISSSSGHCVKFAGDLYSPGNDPRVLLRHGNEYTMFNAPDITTKFAPLPIGYFITRIVADYWHQHLAPGQNVSELGDQGYPNGLNWKSVVEDAVRSLEFSIADVLIDGIAGKEDVAQTLPITLDDGSTTTLNEVRAQYRHLFTQWVEANGGGEEGALVAVKAGLADYNASFMGWFAQRQAFADHAQLVVMGHTHAPISGLAESFVNYVNSGFECPSVADLNTKTISFAVIAMDSLETTLFQAVKVGAEMPSIQPLEAPVASVVDDPGKDYSCYVVIDNSDSSSDLTLIGHHLDHGHFINLPVSIRSGTSATLWLQDFPHILSAHGSQGSVVYRDERSRDYDFAFSCPKEMHHIQCSGATTFRAKTGNGEWLAPNQVPSSGNPLFVTFTLTT